MYRIELKITKLLKDKKTKDPKRKTISVTLKAEDDLFRDISKDKENEAANLIAGMFLEVIGKEWRKRYPKDFK